MISVVIAAKDQERALARSLAALVPAAVEGLVREVIVVDGGSADGTRTVADAAGCRLIEGSGGAASALKQAAVGARGNWLLFLNAGMVVEGAWSRQAADFIEAAMTAGHGASRAALVIGRRPPGASPLARTGAALGRMLGRMPRGDAALLLSGAFYASLGGHAEPARDVSRDLARRIGWRRLSRLKLQAPRPAY